MEVQGCKRRRVHSFEPNVVALANFSHEYLTNLMPALLKVGDVGASPGNKDEEIQKTVRFEVNMALVASANGFAWSRALRQKLERGTKVKKKLHNIMARQLITCDISSACKQKNPPDMVYMFGGQGAFPLISRPLPPITSQLNAKPRLGMQKSAKSKRVRQTSSSKRKPLREDDEVDDRIGTLRTILPGGNDMGAVELLSEVGSYIICLKLQVNILRSLLTAQSTSF